MIGAPTESTVNCAAHNTVRQKFVLNRFTPSSAPSTVLSGSFIHRPLPPTLVLEVLSPHRQCGTNTLFLYAGLPQHSAPTNQQAILVLLLAAFGFYTSLNHHRCCHTATLLLTSCRSDPLSPLLLLRESARNSSPVLPRTPSSNLFPFKSNRCRQPHRIPSWCKVRVVGNGVKCAVECSLWTGPLQR